MIQSTSKYQDPNQSLEVIHWFILLIQCYLLSIHYSEHLLFFFYQTWVTIQFILEHYASLHLESPIPYLLYLELPRLLNSHLDFSSSSYQYLVLLLYYFHLLHLIQISSFLLHHDVSFSSSSFLELSNQYLFHTKTMGIGYYPLNLMNDL